jgi:hypothetical protein
MQNDMEQQLAGEIKLAHSFFPQRASGSRSRSSRFIKSIISLQA